MKQKRTFCKRLLTALLSVAMVFTSINMPGASMQAQAAATEETPAKPEGFVANLLAEVGKITFAWAGNNAVDHYVLKLGDVTISETATNGMTVEGFAAGKYSFSLYAANANGDLSEAAVAEATVTTGAETPTYQPNAGENLGENPSGGGEETPAKPEGFVANLLAEAGKITFAWAGNNAVDHYVLKLGDVTISETATNGMTVEGFAAGKYSFSLYAANANGDLSEAAVAEATVTTGAENPTFQPNAGENPGENPSGGGENSNPEITENLITSLGKYINTAQATIDDSTTPGTYVIDITNKGTANYHVQLTAQPTLVVDTVYNLSFDIQAEKNAKIDIAIQNTDYTSSIIDQKVYDIPGGEAVHFSLNTNKATFTNGNVALMFGNQNANVGNTITLSNVSFTAGAKTENIPTLPSEPDIEPVKADRVVISEQKTQAFVDNAVVLSYVANKNDFTFGDDYTVTIDDKDVEKSNVTIAENTITLAGTLFPTEKVYKIQFAKEGYEVTPVYQRVYATDSTDQWNLVWNDEFDGTSLDMNKWDYQTGNGSAYGISGWGNQEEEYYTDSSENSRVSDGTLTITAKKDSSHAGSNYTSARIRTVTEEIVNGKANLGEALCAKAYGRVEAKMKMPTGDGVWPAFWLLPYDSEYGTWATSGELDIMEARGRLPQEVGGTIHYGGVWPNNVYRGKTHTFAADTSIADYHIYAVEWDPTEITWLVDGVEYGSITNWYAEAGEEGNWPFPAPFDEEFYVLLNLAVGGTYDSEVSSDEVEVDENGVEMDVDYVRWYQRDAEVYKNLESNQPVTEKDNSETAKQLLALADANGNFIVNGDFTEEETIPVYKAGQSWDIERGSWFGLTEDPKNGSGKAAWEIVEDGVKINVSEVGSQTYSSQMIQYFPLVEGYDYEISYTAWTDSVNPKADISLKMGGDGDNGWGGYSGNYSDKLTTTPTTYSHKFSMVSTTDPTARFEFNLGTSAGNVYITDVSVKFTTIDESEGEDDAKDPLSDGNHIYNGEFIVGSDGLLYWHWTDDDAENVVEVVKEDGDRVAKVTVGATPVSMWQNGINLLQNDSYKLNFSVNGAAAQEIKVAFTNADGTETYYETTKSVEAGAQDVEVTFTQPVDKTDAESKMVITFASTASVDSVKLVRTTSNNVDFDFVNMWPLYNGDFYNGTDGWNIWNQGAGWQQASVNDAGQLSVDVTMGAGGVFYDVGIQSPAMQLTDDINYIVKFDYTLPSEKTYILELAGEQREITLEAGTHTYVSEPFKGDGSCNLTLYLGPNQTSLYNLLLDNVVVCLDPNLYDIPEEFAKPVSMKQQGYGMINSEATVIYTEDTAWETASKQYYLNGEEIDANKVTIDTATNMITIDGSCFTVGGEYTFAVKAEGYTITNNAKLIILKDSNILLNGDFSNGTDSWGFYMAEWNNDDGSKAADGSFQVNDEQVAVINHKWDSGQGWHFQLFQEGLEYTAGDWVVSFDAWSDVTRPIGVQLQNGNNVIAGTEQNALLTTKQQPFKFLLKNLTANSGAKLDFPMGSNITYEGVTSPNDGENPHNIYIDNIVFRPATDEDYTDNPTAPTVDKTALTTLITQCNALVQADYTTDSWSAFAAILATAKEVADKTDATQAEVDAAKTELEAAKNALVPAEPVTEVEKGGLNALIAECEALVQADYTIDSWSAFAAILATAKEVAAKADATQTEVDAAKTELEAAKNALVPAEPVTEVEKGDLNALIAECEALVQADYTTDSWSAFAAILATAKEVATKTDATQTEVDAAKTNLEEAKNALVTILEATEMAKTELKALITGYATLKESDYTADSWVAFAAKLTAAQAVADKTDATLAEVETAKADLEAAAEALVTTAEATEAAKTKLQTLITGYETLKESDYTADSWAAFAAKLEAAKAVVDKADATLEELEAAETELKAAEEALETILEVTEATKNELKALIVGCESLNESDYTVASWTGFEAKLEAAKAVAAKADATLSEVEAAKADLEKAVEELVTIESEREKAKIELQAVIDGYASLKESDYTADSWAVFATRMAEAQAVLNNADATLAEIKTAKIELQAAYGWLQKVEDEEKDNNNDENKVKVGLWAEDIADQTYTGTAIKPAVIVYDGETLLRVNKDYSIKYSANKNVGEALIKITGKGNYSGSIEKTFKIVAKDLGDADIVAENLYVNAPTGKKVKAVTPKPVVTRNGKKLVANKDYVVTTPDTAEGAYINPGTYKVTILPAENSGYTGKKEITITLADGKEQVLMSKVSIAKIANQKYNNGEEIKPEVTVTYKGKNNILTKDVDYTVSYSNNKEIGTATVTITGTGTKYVGTKSVTFKITGTQLTAKMITGIPKSVEYTGSAITPEVSISGLTKDQNYTVEYQNNTDPGKATVIVKGIKDYTGTVKKTFKIDKFDIKKNSDNRFKVVSENIKAAYAKGGSRPDVEVTFNEEKLVLGVHYTLSYQNNKAVNGTKQPTLSIVGKGIFKGTVNGISFEIEKQKLDNLNAGAADILEKNAKKYDKVNPVIKDLDGKTLKKGTDYTITGYTYADDSEIKETPVVGAVIKVTAEGKGNYEGKITAEFKVIAQDKQISKATVKVEEQFYTGKEIKPAGEDVKVTIKVKEGNTTVTKQLTEGKDYEITGYSKNTNKGTAKLTIHGIGEYGGTKTVSFKIKAQTMDWADWYDKTASFFEGLFQ